jgi:hypothetical protein
VSRCKIPLIVPRGILLPPQDRYVAKKDCQNDPYDGNDERIPFSEFHEMSSKRDEKHGGR